MKRVLIVLAAAIGAGAFLLGFSGRDAGLTTVYIVRHAEAEKTGDDPVLSARGVERAEALARMLRSQELVAVYATPLRRAAQTAAPVAREQGISVTTYHPADLKSLSRSVQDDHRGGAILVVGHSNTVPSIANAVGGRTSLTIHEDQHDHLLIVTITPDDLAGLQHLRYGG